ncbi:methyltransferase [Streptomyces pini]|uniref:O-methyltransferase n=1 Tax=Streptomyces pini TaxID=1520580 RepID=A0A1I3XWD7_9ACTN|nr:methyltransferase [Streptomyces pini]SFK23855.1 O-methyltransferase [Streptomyces pini]
MAEDASAGTGLWAMADLVTPMALRVAATLRLADHITAGLRTAPELAAATDSDTDALDRTMRHLVSVGVLGQDSSGGYTLTARGRELRGDHPSGLRGVLDLDGALGRADLAFVRLPHSVRTGEAAFPAQFGKRFWEDLAENPALTASYDAQMGTDVAAWAEDILPAYDWESLGRVVDVGGGNGTLLTALLRAYPALRGTVLDQPDTAAAARETLAAAGLTDRGDAVPGDFFETLPPGAGGYLLCAILHDWDDDAARAILRRCGEAAGEHGRVFVIEMTGPDGVSPDTGMDLRMLAYFGGRERGVGELTALAAHAGLRTVAVHHAGRLAIIELTTG